MKNPDDSHSLERRQLSDATAGEFDVSADEEREKRRRRAGPSYAAPKHIRYT